ncbi:MAG: fibronectin type III domain-containing protein [Candidatus Eisenbacteria bacterium]|uniref:Fibronectin type III domain-containing protein n=1 Tax=Eiseniibacteriota bacterium TaxID=2212470 RepID=A0A956M3I2_UNCEI|nr:fibronectin type III domain-containing protein [Candidatus Eisenbacteria bacterium]
MTTLVHGCGLDRARGRMRGRVCGGAILLVALAGGCSDQADKPTDPGDTTAPAAVTDLRVESVTANSADLAWTSPGDDGSVGTATLYDLRFSRIPITDDNWSAAGGAADEPVPLAAGTPVSFTLGELADTSTYYFALRTIDEAGNRSELSNVVSATTPLAPDPYDPSDYATMAGLVADGLAAIDPFLPAVADFVGRAPGEVLTQSSHPSGPAGAPTGIGDCPTFDWQVDGRDASLTIDYGAGCVAPDGVTRSGSILLAGTYRQSTGLDLSAQFSQFFVDDGSEPYEIDGTFGLEGSRTQVALTVDAEVIRRIASSTSVVATVTMDITTGADAWDTEFVLNGSGSAVQEGATFSFSMVDVVWPAGCYTPESGVVHLHIPPEYLDDFGLPGSSELTVDLDFAAPEYDAPVCDGVVLVTVGPYHTEVTLWE